MQNELAEKKKSKVPRDYLKYYEHLNIMNIYNPEVSTTTKALLLQHHKCNEATCFLFGVDNSTPKSNLSLYADLHQT